MADTAKRDERERDQRHYSAHGLNIVFTLSSLVLLGATLLMLWKDYDREWRTHQKSFRAIELAQTREALATEDERLGSLADYAATSNRVAVLASAQANRQDELDALAKDQDRASRNLAVAVQDLNFVKADASAKRYQLEAAHSHHDDNADALKADYEALRLRVLEKTTIVDAEQAKVEALAGDIALRTRDLDQASKEQDQLTMQRDLLARRLAKLDPAEMNAATRLGDAVRDLPLLEGMNPRYNLRDHQIIVNGITEDLIFTRVPRVDRCTACHLAIDRKGFEDQQHPYKTHPDLDLYLGVSSPHPVKEFGCTSCHAGRGRGTSFTSAAHTPSSPEQAAEWKEAYGWKKLHHWDAPMHPARFTQAGCFECHAGATQTTGAENLNLGLALIERSGCYGCHQIEKYEARSPVGPSLQHIQSKVTPPWAYHWLNDPKGFRAHSWMPAFFNQTNNGDIKTRTDQEANAMVQYLMRESSEYETPHDAMPKGDPTRGQDLVRGLGCQGCHMLEDEAYPDTLTLQALRRQQGPALSGLGSKTTPLWVYNWLKDPQSYHPATRMPNLRLSDQEAADAAAYLVSLRHDDFAKGPVPDAAPGILDDIALEFMVPGMTRTQAREKLATMTVDEKQQYCGSKLIRRYGCFGCHDIPGFEDARPIGTALTEIASKSVSKLDFALQHDLPHINYAWFEAKLKNPRLFDEGMVKEAKELLKMPNFSLDDDEISSIVTALLGFKTPDESLRKMVPRTPRHLAIEKGDALVRELNCRGCHVLGDDGGAVHESVAYWLENIKTQAAEATDGEAEEDDEWAEEEEWGEESDVDVAALARAYSPPNLTGEGAKVQPAWLFHFLKAPEPIRPWLSMRMPTYGMSDEQRNAFTAYFSSLADAAFPFVSVPSIDTNSASFLAGRDMFTPQVMSCARCHIAGDKTPVGSTEDNWAPDLAKAHERLRGDWILKWLEDPAAIEPGTKMPAYWPENEPSPVKHLDGDSERQREAIRDYIFSLGAP